MLIIQKYMNVGNEVLICDVCLVSKCLDRKSQPKMAGIDSFFTTMKLWEASSVPKSAVVVSVPSGVNCLPSALRNVVCVKVRFVWGMREAWHEAPESNNTFKHSY